MNVSVCWRAVWTLAVALWLPAVLVACFVAELLLSNEVGLLSARFSAAIIAHAEPGAAEHFVRVACVGMGVIVATNIVKTLRQFVQDALVICWRQRLTRNIHALYFSCGVFYRMVVLGDRVDNPDHRITVDVSNCVRKLVDIVANVMSAPLTVVFYTAATYMTMGWQGPVTCYVFFCVGSVLNKVLISPVVALRFAQERQEGDFRFGHVSLRTHAETVAFYAGADREHDIANSLLGRVTWNLWRIAGRMFLLNCTFPGVSSSLCVCVLGG